MKSLSPALQSHLDSGATTLAWCWRLVRRNGTSLGFTDHDRDLAFDGVTYEAATGFTASEIKDTVGLSIDNLQVQSALSSARLSEDDLAGGLYDDAAVEIWRVNWSDPSQRVLMRSGSLGEITRAGAAFSAEVRGLAHYLNQPRGRVYQYTCDADLGDARCGVDLLAATNRATVAVAAGSTTGRLVVTNLSAIPAERFTRGVATLTSGANAGQRREIRRHLIVDGAAALDLWQPLAQAPTVGDTLTLTAGCDKTFATCRTRFDNAARFRGFPHMPGNDFVVTVARESDVNDGTALR